MFSYKSDYPNHVHQLNVCISKHYYATRDGLLKYQQKAMDMSLARSSLADRRHMLVYCIRDHCSGVFYAEIDFSPAAPVVPSFLGRAWGRKNDYAFCGVPNVVSIPKNVKEVSPELEKTLSASGVTVYEPKSGFEAGVRDIRTIESGLDYAIGKPIDFAKSEVAWIMRSHSEKRARVGRLSKIELWQKNAKGLYMPPIEGSASAS